MQTRSSLHIGIICTEWVNLKFAVFECVSRDMSCADRIVLGVMVRLAPFRSRAQNLLDWNDAGKELYHLDGVCLRSVVKVQAIPRLFD